ncbi:hypothetical protein RB201_17965 [Streptomyces sp. S1A(2023)]
MLLQALLMVTNCSVPAKGALRAGAAVSLEALTVGAEVALGSAGAAVLRVGAEDGSEDGAAALGFPPVSVRKPVRSSRAEGEASAGSADEEGSAAVAGPRSSEGF